MEERDLEEALQREVKREVVGHENGQDADLHLRGDERGRNCGDRESERIGAEAHGVWRRVPVGKKRREWPGERDDGRHEEREPRADAGGGRGGLPPEGGVEPGLCFAARRLGVEDAHVLDMWSDGGAAGDRTVRDRFTFRVPPGRRGVRRRARRCAGNPPMRR